MLTASMVFPLAQDAQAFYNPQTGCWPNRDPLHETGGANLYGFVNNCPLGFIDAYGKKPTPGPLPPNVLKTPTRCCFKSSGNNPVSIPVGESDSAASSFLGGVEMISSFLKNAAEQSIFNSYIAKGYAECAAQAENNKGGCCGCCLIRLFLTVQKQDYSFTMLHYNSADYYQQSCGSLQYQEESQTGGETLSADYRTYSTQLFTGKKVSWDWQFYDPQYVQYCPSE